jgi:nucleoside-diphosphate-sugar epimerase
MAVKVFITGVGSDLGTQMARHLEQRDDVEAVAGVDMFPPRRYLAKTEFSICHYDDSERISDVIVNFAPDVIINFGVFEPGARLSLSRARGATHASVAGIINAVKRINDDVHVVSRSSVVAYGFNDPQKTKDETTPLSPDTQYGVMCREVEEELFSSVENVSIIRTAPELAAHVPHPLARILAMRAIPIEMRMPFTRDIGFPVISPRNTVEIFVQAATSRYEGHRIFHAACPDNATMMMAAQIGKRVPVFINGLNVALIKRLSFIAGAPVDQHIEMLIRRGMKIDSTSTRMKLDITSQDSPTEILKNLYAEKEKAFDTLIEVRL